MATRKQPAKPADTPPETPQEPINLHEAVGNFKRTFSQAVLKRANEFDPDEMAKELIKDLDAAKREVVAKLLGFDNRYGEWEVDHCNGRESPITNYIQQECGDVVRQWVHEAVLEELTDAKKNSLKAAVREALKAGIDNHFRELSWHYSRDHAKEIANGIVNEVRKEVNDAMRGNS